MTLNSRVCTTRGYTDKYGDEQPICLRGARAGYAAQGRPQSWAHQDHALHVYEVQDTGF